MRLLRLFILITALSGLVGLGAAMPVQGATDPIQPGDYVGSSAGGCTLNFVYDGTGPVAGKVYIGTAAHCVDKVGDPVTLDSGETFGRAAALGNYDTVGGDWALIEVDPAYVGRLSPSVLGHSGTPTGVTSSSETSVGDELLASGYGMGFDLTPTTRQARFGYLMYDDASEHDTVLPYIYGDSGGPVIHAATGKALGIVSSLCNVPGSTFGACTESGPTVEGALAKMAAAGFPVQLRTV